MQWLAALQALMPPCDGLLDTHTPACCPFLFRNFIAIKENFHNTWLNPVAALVRHCSWPWQHACCTADCRALHSAPTGPAALPVPIRCGATAVTASRCLPRRRWPPSLAGTAGSQAAVSGW